MLSFLWDYIKFKKALGFCCRSSTLVRHLCNGHVFNDRLFYPLCFFFCHVSAIPLCASVYIYVPCGHLLGKS